MPDRTSLVAVTCPPVHDEPSRRPDSAPSPESDLASTLYEKSAPTGLPPRSWVFLLRQSAAEAQVMTCRTFVPSTFCSTTNTNPSCPSFDSPPAEHAASLWVSVFIL